MEVTITSLKNGCGQTENTLPVELGRRNEVSIRVDWVLKMVQIKSNKWKVKNPKGDAFFFVHHTLCENGVG